MDSAGLSKGLPFGGKSVSGYVVPFSQIGLPLDKITPPTPSQVQEALSGFSGTVEWGVGEYSMIQIAYTPDLGLCLILAKGIGIGGSVGISIAGPRKNE